MTTQSKHGADFAAKNREGASQSAHEQKVSRFELGLLLQQVQEQRFLRVQAILGLRVDQ